MRLKVKSIAALSIAFLTFSLIFQMHINGAIAEEDGAAQVLSHSSYMEYKSYRITSTATGTSTHVSGNFVHVVGEVQNVIEENIEIVSITGIFYDENGAVLEARTRATPYISLHPLDILAPGQKSPFEIILLDAAASTMVASYEVLVESNITMEEPAMLGIPNHSSHIVAGNYFEVIGEVENIGVENIKLVWIFATFYDQQGTVIRARIRSARAFDILVPGQKSPFSFLGQKEITEKIQTYSLCAEGTITTKEPYREFQIITHNSEIYYGDYKVSGVVKNVGETDATHVEGVATYYDSNGIIIAKKILYIEGIDLAAGQTTPFSVYVGEEVAKKVDSYTLQFQCNEMSETPQIITPTTPEHSTPEPTEPAETPFITTEIAILAAVAVACVTFIVSFWALRKRK